MRLPFLTRAERYFEFAALGTNWKTEILAGVTTFMTMAYIIFVNPSILHEAGMPIAGVTAATCLAAAVGSFLMGAFARYPIALAPGMGLNAYFTYSVVKGMGVDWHVALGAVFLSGIAFLILTARGHSADDRHGDSRGTLLRRWRRALGCSSRSSGFATPGIIVPNASTTVALGNLRDPATLLALFGLLVIGGAAWRAGSSAAILIGVRRDLGARDRYGNCALAAAAIQLPRYHLDRDATRYSRGAGARACSRSSSCFCLWICSTTSARCWRLERKPGCSRAQPEFRA